MFRKKSGSLGLLQEHKLRQKSGDNVNLKTALLCRFRPTSQNISRRGRDRGRLSSPTRSGVSPSKVRLKLSTRKKTERRQEKVAISHSEVISTEAGTIIILFRF
jgi:hypothetical protein